MKRTLAALLALSLPGVVAALASSCAEPSNDCTAGHGLFAVRYTLVPGSKQGDGTCDQLTGELVGLEKYNPATMGDGGESDGSPGAFVQDLTRAFLVVRSNTLGSLANNLVTPDMTAAQVQKLQAEADSVGNFSSIKPDANGICTVPTLSPAEIKAPMMGMTPATDIKYVWSNVRVLVTPSYDGLEMAADLTFTQDGCTAQYQALGLFPGVSCSVPPPTDDAGNPIGNPTTDPTLCDPAANLDKGHAFGSGINPDFQPNVECDPTLMLCVLQQAPAGLQ
jgi:hypothetical protein